MFTVINRGELSPTTEHEFENFNSRLKGLWLTEHNEDGTHKLLNPTAIPNLDASKITSGTLADARLSSNVALKDAANIFTLLNTFNTGVKVTGSPSFAPGVLGFFSNTTSIVGGTNGFSVVKSDGTVNNLVVSNTGQLFERGRSVAIGELTAYTPSWTNNGTANTLGNATLTGNYFQIGKLVFFRIQFVWGNTTVSGSGAWFFSFPLTTDGSGLICGGMASELFDSSTGVRYPTGAINNGTTIFLPVQFQVIGGVGTAVAWNTLGATAPFTWATGDTAQFSGWYSIP
jgi:hypothetical protein